MSNEVKTKEKIDMDPKYIVKLTVTLLGTCLIVALLLGLVNGVTAGPIAEINQQKTEAAMLAVVSDPDNTTFSDALELSGNMTAAATAAGGTLNEMYEVQVNGEAAGYAVKVTASGSQGSIEMMVGVDAEGAVTGVSVVNHSETSGIGTKVVGNEPTASGVGVLDQFIGKSAADGTLTVGTNVDAITGATITSSAVMSAVNSASSYIADSGTGTDGTLTGEGSGFGGPITVEVTMDGDDITSVTIVSNSETPSIAANALEQIPAAIVEADTADVDIVAGATYTSNGIIQCRQGCPQQGGRRHGRCPHRHGRRLQ